MSDPFAGETSPSDTIDGLYDDAERSLANRNSGTLLETLSLDVTPIGAHYLLTHFDTPIISRDEHVCDLLVILTNHSISPWKNCWVCQRSRCQ